MFENVFKLHKIKQNLFVHLWIINRFVEHILGQKINFKC